MRHRQNCSLTSAPFRYEWRASRHLLAAIGLIGLLAAFAALNCDIPSTHAWPLAGLALCWALLLARREWRRPGCTLLIPGPPQPPRLDDVALLQLELLERGPLVLLRWRSADARGSLLFLADTLPRARRRELRLAVHAHAVSREAGEVAP